MPFSFDVGRLFGIKIRVHALFLALIVLFFFSQSAGTGLGSRMALLVYLGLLFAFVLVHELGHAIAARRFGVRVVDITLWPLGGMARLSQVPETPHVELLVASAGPIVNLVLGGLFIAIASLGSILTASQLFDVWGWFAMADLSLASILAYSIGVNLIMGVFNLVPAFPLDGGRVLRALLGARLDFLTATVWAASIGRAVAIGLCLLAAFTTLLGFELPLLAFLVIAIFVHIAGRQEVANVRARKLQEAAAAEEPLTEISEPVDPPRLSRDEYQRLVDRLPREEQT